MYGPGMPIEPNVTIRQPDDYQDDWQSRLRNEAGVERFSLSTELIGKSERFDYFCNFAADHFLGSDHVENWSDEFTGRISGHKVGDVSVVYSTTSPGRWVRSRRSAIQSDDAIVISQLTAGSGKIVCETPFDLGPGSVCLIPTTHAYERQVFELQDRIAIKIPRAAVETALLPGKVIAPMMFAPNDPIINLLLGYVETYSRQLDEFGNSVGSVAGRHIADLVALAIGAHRDAQFEIAEGGLKIARREAILEAIAKHSASPLTSPATIGGTLGISERHVHRLLEETNRTFNEHLLEARLSNAHRLLRDVRSTGLSIAEIARRSGFINVTYFNRVFRIRFGDTPTGVRGARD